MFGSSSGATGVAACLSLSVLQHSSGTKWQSLRHYMEWVERAVPMCLSPRSENVSGCVCKVASWPSRLSRASFLLFLVPLFPHFFLHCDCVCLCLSVFLLSVHRLTAVNPTTTTTTRSRSVWQVRPGSEINNDNDNIETIGNDEDPLRAVYISPR